MYIIYNGNKIIDVFNILNKENYDLTKFNDYWSWLINFSDYKILINTISKTFTLFLSSNDILPIVKGHYVKSINDFDELMNILGFNMSTFKTFINSGNYIILEKLNQIYYGIIINHTHAMIFDSTGNNISYISNFTENEPYKILKVCKPSDIYFKVKDIDNMEVLWERPKNRVKKSISEIEKELNLEPGTLEIYG